MLKLNYLDHKKDTQLIPKKNEVLGQSDGHSFLF